jgi:hypothetical protein
VNTELGLLLERAVPEPPRLLDADVILRSARRRVRHRVATGLAALAVAAVVGPMTAVRLQPDPVDVTDVPLHLSALDRRQPIGEVAAHLLVGQRLVHPGQASLTREVDRWQILLAETVDGEICVVAVRESQGDGAGGDCQPRPDLLTTGVMFATTVSGDHADPALIIVVVPDGYTRAAIGATADRVSNNVGLLRGVFSPEDELVISGPDLPTVAFPLDDIVPPR